MPPKLPKRLWTIEDFMNYVSVSRSTIYGWVADGKVPFIKVNGVLRFDPDAVLDWLREAARKSLGKG